MTIDRLPLRPLSRRAGSLLAVVGAAALGLGLLTGAPPEAEAFCGFYVAGADTQLFNDATMVVMMRDGKRTVLAMQNDYQGPPEDFAMVVPVPVVLSEETVKTLPKEVFDRVDKLAAPRLVEYWEEDPCAPQVEYDKMRRTAGVPMPTAEPAPEDDAEYGVTVEAQFTVAEYEIVILSASDSTGLDTWLRDKGYKIPKGAEPLLRPYVEGGSKFFVAKVDASKVKFETRPDGSKRATLSPLRFHYDTDEFSLPIRLGLINAPQGQGGAQDLLVHVLARSKRYQVANYPNVTIPTNIEVKDQTRDHFGQFYVSLFDHTLEQHPKAVVTEYAWAANSCDPCPEPALTLQELVTLGADVLPSFAGQLDGEQISPDLEWSVPSQFVLTRLHARYDQSSLGEDLVFEEAPAIAGGREFLQENGVLERGAQPSANNQFQARYIIRHPWTGPVECENPQRGNWGGPPDGGPKQPTVARKLATVDRTASLGSFVTAESGKILGVAATAPEPAAPAEDEGGAGEGGDAEAGKDDKKEAPSEAKAEAETKALAKTEEKANTKGCRCGASEGSAGGLGLGLLALLALAGVRRRETD
jgi:MYXO-CTERM domain-containing protein